MSEFGHSRKNGHERGLVSFNPYLPVIEANTVDPDQTPRSAASDLGLHCLPMSQFVFDNLTSLHGNFSHNF